jgi:hypothetical protein
MISLFALRVRWYRREEREGVVLVVGHIEIIVLKQLLIIASISEASSRG